MIVPPSVATAQVLPVVEIEYVNGEPTVVFGVPEMVKVVPVTEDVTPDGNPVTVAPVAPPLKV